jgi:hypothetical protein
MVPVAPIITGIIFVFTFHMRCISIVKFLYFRICSTSFFVTILSHYIIIIIIIIIIKTRSALNINGLQDFMNSVMNFMFLQNYGTGNGMSA